MSTILRVGDLVSVSPITKGLPAIEVTVNRIALVGTDGYGSDTPVDWLPWQEVCGRRMVIYYRLGVGRMERWAYGFQVQQPKTPERDAEEIKVLAGIYREQDREAQHLVDLDLMAGVGERKLLNYHD